MQVSNFFVEVRDQNRVVALVLIIYVLNEESYQVDPRDVLRFFLEYIFRIGTEVIYASFWCFQAIFHFYRWFILQVVGVEDFNLHLFRSFRLFRHLSGLVGCWCWKSTVTCVRRVEVWICHSCLLFIQHRLRKTWEQLDLDLQDNKSDEHLEVIEAVWCLMLPELPVSFSFARVLEFSIIHAKRAMSSNLFPYYAQIDLIQAFGEGNLATTVGVGCVNCRWRFIFYSYGLTLIIPCWCVEILYS